MEQNNDVVKYICNLHAQADAELQRWKDHYEELAKYFIPMKDNVYGGDTTGERKQNLLFDSTSVHANEMLASMLHTLLSSPNQEFFSLTSGDPEIDRDDEVRAWVQKTTRKMHTVLGGTNYHSQAHEGFLDMGGFGTLVMRQEEDFDDVMNFEASPCYNFSFIENAKGVVDSIFRTFEYTLTQCKEKFPETLGKELLQRQETFPLEKHKVLHAIVPRSKYNMLKKNRTNKKYGSYYILLTKGIMLEESGYDRFPYIVSRWHVISGETRGRGPSMKALPDARVLNALQKTVLRTAQKIADPAYLIPDDGVMRPFKTAPGSINYYRAGTKDPLINLDNNARPDFAEQVSDNIRERIKKAFFVDQMMLQQGPQMTATEVMQRAEEQLRMLGPVQGRMTNEYLKPLAENTYYIMSKRGMIDAPPEKLKGISLRVQFKSTMSRSQSMLEIENLNRMVGTLAPFLQITPEIIDMLDPEQILRYVTDLHAIPQELIRNKTEIAAIRDMRDEQAMEQEDMMMEQQEAETAKTTADAASAMGV